MRNAPNGRNWEQLQSRVQRPVYTTKTSRHNDYIHPHAQLEIENRRKLNELKHDTISRYVII